MKLSPFLSDLMMSQFYDISTEGEIKPLLEMSLTSKRNLSLKLQEQTVGFFFSTKDYLLKELSSSISRKRVVSCRNFCQTHPLRGSLAL